MRKIIVLGILTIFFTGCASTAAPASSTTFDSDVNPFIGEWKNIFAPNSINEWTEEWIFIDNQFTLIDSRGRNETGTYTFTHNRIHFTTETGNWSQIYRFQGKSRFGLDCLT